MAVSKKSLSAISGNLCIYGALFYAFCIPLNQKLATISLLCWLLFSLLNFSAQAVVKNKLLLVLPLLYFTYIAGSLINGAASFSFLEHKLSFLVFPLVFFLHRYNPEERVKILKTFINGVIIASILCLAMALYRSLSITPEGINFVPNVLEGKNFYEAILYGGNHFFGRYFSIFHQTVYFSLYLCTAIAILVFKSGIFQKQVRYLLVGFLMVVMFLVSNKAGFVALGVVFLIRILTVDLMPVKKGLAALAFLSLAAFIATTNPRINESLKKVLRGELALDKDARYDFAARLLSWDAAVHLIRDRPVTGYGAGNAQNELNAYYQENAYAFPLKESLNAHNQYLQAWIENGLVGLLVFCFVFFLLLRVVMSNTGEMVLFLTIVLILMVNALFESIFNRFSGVSFFSFLVCFIFSAYNHTSHSK